MFTAQDAAAVADEKWDERIRAAVDRSDEPGHSFLLVDDHQEGTEASYELKRRGFWIYDLQPHDHECERLPFSWSNHRG